MDGKTSIELGFGSSHNTLRSRPRRVAAGAGEQIEMLRAGLSSATVETLAEGSNPRLSKTAYARTAA
jgi:hypothetical protein